MHIEPIRSEQVVGKIQELQAPPAAAAEITSTTTTTMAPQLIFMSGNGQPMTTGGDMFDGNNEPIIYMSENRMPVMIEFNNAIIYIIFVALLLAFVAILPGIRRTKLTSFISVLTVLMLGASILLAIEGTHWLTGGIQIYQAPYGALTSEKISGKLEINIGLASTNVTLFGHLVNTDNVESSTTNDGDYLDTQNVSTIMATKTVDYNERFQWDKPDRMAAEHEQALRKGLPYPILTITEFLSQDADGFNWMRQLRQAGHFTSLALYASLVAWCLTTVVMCALPVYLPHMMQITGALLMSSVWIYTLLIQSPNSFVIQLGENPIEFAFGHTYVITFVAGALSMFAGVLLFVLKMSNSDREFTIMDSEQYLKDQKALAGSINGNLDLNKQLAATNKNCLSKAFQQQDSVIIPIEDIEAKFNSKF